MKWWLVTSSLLLAAAAYAQPAPEPVDPPEMPVEAAPVEAAPAETAPVEAAPAEAQPVEAQPVEAAVEAAPVEAEPVEAAPVEPAPAEATPEDVAAEAASEVLPSSYSAPWSIGTAHTLPEGRLEVGVFQPLRVGVSPSVELSTHVLLDVVAPNLALKKAWTHVGDGEWLLASRHSVWYPSGLLNLLAREGTGGILPEETRVPHIVMVNNEILLSVAAFAAHTVTARAGVTLAATLGQSTLRSIDLPLVYPRLAAVFAPASFVLGADLDGELPGPFAYTVDVDVFLVADSTAPFALEHSGLATWRATSEFAVQVGYKLVFGAYPGGPDGFRTQWHILPLVDLVWAF